MKFNAKIAVLITITSLNCFAQTETTNRLAPFSNYQMKYIHLKTRWAKDVSPNNNLREYPRPQLKRENWVNLNGIWEYAITDSTTDTPSSFEGNILVPYSIESALSGVQKSLTPEKRLWYRKLIQCPKLSPDERIILNFGAIDWESTIFINNKQIGKHSGGYQSFGYDITAFLIPGNNEIRIKVYDPSDQGVNPHGKQVLKPANIYYTPSSGIWQTVWLERVSATHIKQIKTTPDIDKGTLSVQLDAIDINPSISVEVTASENGKVVTRKKVSLANNSTLPTFILPIPNARLWSPDDPFLYDLKIKLLKGNKIVDEVTSYFGMRKINIQKDEKGADRIFLNNKYTFNLGILDQGFWPEGLYTAPTDEALAFDLKTIKSMGFNTIRKHIKIEPERWYYYADKIGILVWQDFVNPPHGLPNGSKPTFEKETKETMDQLYNHPSIITWVVFNERWGAYDQQRITEWVKKYDPSRIVNGHSGELLYVNNELRAPSDNPWVSSDMSDVHSYPEPRSPQGLPGKAKVIGEFGGIGVAVPGHQWDDLKGWGYIQSSADELKEKYKQMSATLKRLELEGLSAAIYTQPFDVEGEENGLLTYDREIIKIPIIEIRSINQNLVNQGKAFTLDSNFIIATNIDANDNDSRYTELLGQYENGNRDSILLRRLTLMALRKKDQIKATQIGNTYISSLSDPFNSENLHFFIKVTNTTKDAGFALLNSNAEKVNDILGEITAQYKVKRIIEKDELSPYLNSIGNTPNWDSLYQAMSKKYGQSGEELILGKQMIYHHNISHDWKSYGKYYELYFKKAYKHPDFIINDLTWELFLTNDDPAILAFALHVMKYAIETWDHSPEAFDTYANLLHKLKKSNEAIEWEEKAVEMRKGSSTEKIFAETLQKMKAGLPTWPQTQNN